MLAKVRKNPSYLLSSFMCLAGARCCPGRDPYQLPEAIFPKIWAVMVSGGGTLKIFHLDNIQTITFTF